MPVRMPQDAELPDFQVAQHIERSGTQEGRRGERRAGVCRKPSRQEKALGMVVFVASCLETVPGSFSWSTEVRRTAFSPAVENPAGKYSHNNALEIGLSCRQPKR